MTDAGVYKMGIIWNGEDEEMWFQVTEGACNTKSLPNCFMFSGGGLCVRNGAVTHKRSSVEGKVESEKAFELSGNLLR